MVQAGRKPRLALPRHERGTGSRWKVFLIRTEEIYSLDPKCSRECLEYLVRQQAIRQYCELITTKLRLWRVFIVFLHNNYEFTLLRGKVS